MPIIAKYNRKEYVPAPEGLQQAVCVDVVDRGLEDTPWGQKPKIDIRWQSEHINPENGNPFLVVKKYTLSLHEKANLRQHLESWRGRKLSNEELESFDLEKLLGVNCQLQIAHNAADEGRAYANVQAIVPQGKGTTKLIPIDYVRVQDREDNPQPQTHEPPPDDDLPF